MWTSGYPAKGDTRIRMYLAMSITGLIGEVFLFKAGASEIGNQFQPSFFEEIACSAFWNAEDVGFTPRCDVCSAFLGPVVG